MPLAEYSFKFADYSFFDIWETLREKSRVRIEHPDLPVELREAAGEVIGALW